jgi:hypothetical protein
MYVCMYVYTQKREGTHTLYSSTRNSPTVSLWLLSSATQLSLLTSRARPYIHTHLSGLLSLSFSLPLQFDESSALARSFAPPLSDPFLTSTSCCVTYITQCMHTCRQHMAGCKQDDVAGGRSPSSSSMDSSSSSTHPPALSAASSSGFRPTTTERRDDLSTDLQLGLCSLSPAALRPPGRTGDQEHPFHAKVIIISFYVPFTYANNSISFLPP